jgi:hypothetical protein
MEEETVHPTSEGNYVRIPVEMGQLRGTAKVTESGCIEISMDGFSEIGKKLFLAARMGLVAGLKIDPILLPGNPRREWVGDTPVHETHVMKSNREVDSFCIGCQSCTCHDPIGYLTLPCTKRLVGTYGVKGMKWGAHRVQEEPQEKTMDEEEGNLSGSGSKD